MRYWCSLWTPPASFLFPTGAENRTNPLRRERTENQSSERLRIGMGDHKADFARNVVVLSHVKGDVAMDL